ncbi:MAG: DUF1592 domain-containing protein [Pirellulaceae bacterium]|nr:DUF1592 domain-containing protein [Pirellulaceae bacterium]
MLVPLTLVLICQVIWADQPAAAASSLPAEVRTLTSDYCLECHSGAEAEAGLDLAALASLPLERHLAGWERVARKLRARQMPPAEMPRPGEATYAAALQSLETALDRIAAARPQPGRTDTFRRLTRIEYQYAIRDLLDLDIDAAALLPKDESSHGFDNITVGELSPTLLNRYITAAERISRLAVGAAGRAPAGDTIRIRPDLTQEHHVPGLPLGTRGGALVPYTFPVDGQYEVRVRLARDRNEEVEGLREPHQFEVLLDRQRLERFDIRPPADGEDYSQVDAHLVVRFAATAGPHELGVTFPRGSPSLLETIRQPYEARFNMHRHPRTNPAVYQVSITGPYETNGAGEGGAGESGAGETPSRQRIFVCRPEGPDDELDCARRILGTLARRAWRQPVTDDDLVRPLEFYRQGRAAADFDAGIQSALAYLLVDPRFLFRIERDPPGIPSGAIPSGPISSDTVYRVSDLELASRLSFFLWSSLPDDELLNLAIGGQLHRPQVLQQQVRRMLADPRSDALVTNFGGQWLYLRNLDAISPDMRLFPDFDHNLRESMRTETELLLRSVIGDDRSVLDLLRADYTFLNERLARHYGIPHVLGSRFRRVALDPASHRGGLLRHASILTVTSYATRTSPVIRGHWILQNLVGTPPPPPPDNVPALRDNSVEASLPVRQRLARHRADPNCASCHKLMDPVGFALEQYDAVGRWRQLEAGLPIDATGGLPDGSRFTGAEGLERALLERPELFVATLTEKLLTYALGRGVDHHDAAAVRRIVREARQDDYCFSSLVQGIARSLPFQMRMAE